MMRDNGVLAWLRGKSGDEDAPQAEQQALVLGYDCLLYTSPSPRD